MSFGLCPLSFGFLPRSGFVSQPRVAASATWVSSDFESTATRLRLGTQPVPGWNMKVPNPRVETTLGSVTQPLRGKERKPDLYSAQRHSKHKERSTKEQRSKCFASGVSVLRIQLQ